LAACFTRFISGRQSSILTPIKGPLTLLGARPYQGYS